MDRLIYKNKNIFCIGDIHGELKRAVHDIISKKIDNAVVIVAGDCGIGFNKEGYYNKTFMELDSKLAKHGIVLLLLRGNHDNPYWFNTKPIIFDNIRTIRDYTIVSIEYEYKPTYNILCVGGAISIDRLRRIEFDTQRNKWHGRKNYKYTYWCDEGFVLDEESLSTLYDVDCLVTHANPYHKNGILPSYLNYWFDLDDKLKIDILNEHTAMRNMLDILLLNGNSIKYWVNGHYHTSSVEYINIFGYDVKCISIRNIENGIEIVDIGGVE